MAGRGTREDAGEGGRLTSDGLAVGALGPWRSWAVTGGLWALVICGALAGVVGLARSGATGSQGSTVVPDQPDVAPGEVLGTAEWAVRVSLTGPDPATASGVVADPAGRRRAGVAGVDVVAATAVRAEPVEAGYWAVVVATDVRSDGRGSIFRWFLEIGVVETGAGPVAVTDPALVPAPVAPVGSVELTGPGPGRPDRSDPVTETVSSFLTALVTGDPAVNRWTAPGVDVWPAAEAGVFGDVELTGITVTRHAGSAATARAELSVEIDDDSVVVFAYTVQLVEREGRWEVTDVGGAPPISGPVNDPDEEPSVPPSPAATGVRPAPAPTSPPVTGGGSSSPIANP
jgi:hypothetical protein